MKIGSYASWMLQNVILQLEQIQDMDESLFVNIY